MALVVALSGKCETLLVVDDEEDFVDLTTGVLSRIGYEVVTAGSPHEAVGVLAETFVDLMLLDERLGRSSGVHWFGELRLKHPGLAAIIISADADLTLAQRAMRAGAVDVLLKPVSETELAEAVQSVLQVTELARSARRNEWVARRTSRPPEIVGDSTALRSLLETVSLVAASPSTVLLQGESGTGKELIAKAIHAASPRRHRSMVSVNLAAISVDLIEVELFGATKGSYTGSVADRKGYFDEANGSTLFLDEIGDAPLHVQSRLLRALEERVVTRVGETRPRNVDIRLIAATNRNLARDVQSGSFREDLYFRLNVVPLVVPPLRERVPDIEPIARFLLSRFAQEMGRPVRGFTSEAISRLEQYPWPGNVRELRNVVERAVILAKTVMLSGEDLHIGMGEASVEWESILELPLDSAAEAFERRYFTRLLQRAGGNKSRAADLAGRDRTTIYAYLKRLGLAEGG